MISGDLIRLKNSVEDCMRSARTIRREAAHLTPDERANLELHIAGNSKQMQYFMSMLSEADALGPTPINQ